MGGGNWASDAYADLSKSRTSQSRSQIFQHTATKTIASDMSPKGLKMRESRDSVEHPESLAIAIFLDETGSMGNIPEQLVKGKLPKTMDTILAHNVPHPQIMFCGVGDHHSDEYPLQVGQFEIANDKLDKWLTSINIEGNGGGNGGESYLLAWLLCARYTSLDCFEKRGIKGFIFTIGDEDTHMTISADALKKLMGGEAKDETAENLLKEAQKAYHVFHIHVKHNHYSVPSRFKNLLQENVLEINNPDDVAELIASTVAVVNGADIADVTKNFSASTATAITTALAKVERGVTKNQNTGIITL